MTTTELTLKTWEIRDADGRLAHRRNDAPGAEYLARYNRTSATRENIYRVGDLVVVSAYGKLCGGIVTKLGRTKVTVKFYSDAARQNLRERAFSGAEIAPCDLTEWTGRFSLNPVQE